MQNILEKIFKVGLILLAIYILFGVAGITGTGGLSMITIMYALIFIGLPLILFVGVPLAILKARNKEPVEPIGVQDGVIDEISNDFERWILIGGIVVFAIVLLTVLF